MLLVAVLIDERAGRVVEALSIQNIQYFIDLFYLLHLLRQIVQQRLSLVHRDNLSEVQLQFYLRDVLWCIFG